MPGVAPRSWRLHPAGTRGPGRRGRCYRTAVACSSNGRRAMRAQPCLTSSVSSVRSAARSCRRSRAVRGSGCRGHGGSVRRRIWPPPYPGRPRATLGGPGVEGHRHAPGRLAAPRGLARVAPSMGSRCRRSLAPSWTWRRFERVAERPSPGLIAAEEACRWPAEQLVHNDVFSGNMTFSATGPSSWIGRPPPWAMPCWTRRWPS